MAMTKDELKAMIDETIVANGQKGITAESLNNALTEMITASGEGGSGDGLLRLNIPIIEVVLSIQDMLDQPLFNQANWDAFYAIVAESGGPMPNLNEVVPTILTQNTEVLEQIWSKFEEGKYPLITLDDSLMSEAYLQDAISLTQEAYPEYTEEQIRAMTESSVPKNSILGIPSAITKIMSEDYSSTARVLLVSMYATDLGTRGYISGGEIVFYLDDMPDAGITAGTMEIHHKSSVSLYFPQDGATLSSDQMSSNTYSYYDYGNYSDAHQASLIKYFIPHLVDAEGEATAQKAPFFITADFYTKEFKYFDGLSLKEAVIASDGSVTVTTLGSLTAPTTESTEATE